LIWRDSSFLFSVWWWRGEGGFLLREKLTEFKADSVLPKLFFWGKGFRKTETNVFEIRREFGFRPAGGCGRNAGRIPFWIFGGGGLAIQKRPEKAMI
jgi:hypothetical protein